MKKKDLKNSILLYSILFVVAALGCYIFFLLNSTTLVKYADGNADGLTQTYTSYVAIKRMLQDLFAGKNIPAWSWSIGLGADTFEYYGFKLFNPLTYLIVAFPERLIDVGYSVVTVLRQYLAGVTFLLCMRENKLSAQQSVVGALSYAFSGWMVEVVFSQGSFENAAIILPLLIMGTDRFLKKKSPILFIVSVALCLTTGITWTYISGIIVLVYYFARYHDFHKGESCACFFKTTGEYIAYGITGIMISAPFMLSILSSLNGATTHTGADSRWWFFSLNKYLSIPEGLFKYTEVGATSYSYIYVSIVCVLLMPMVARLLKKKNTIAWIAVILSALSLIPATSIFFNGMSYAAGRWYYVLVFFVVWATVECLDEETLSSNKNLVIMLIWLLLLVASVVIIFVLGKGSKNGLYATILAALFGCALIALAYLYYSRNIKSRTIVVGATALLLLSLMVPACGRTFPGVNNYLNKYLKVGESYKKLLSTPERVVPNIDDDTFFRVDQGYRINPNMHTKLKTNANIVYGNNSIYTYSSILDAKWNLFNKCVGNNSGYFSRVTVASNDNRPFLDYLLGVKYFLGNNNHEENASLYAGYGYEKTDNIDGVDILETGHCIGLGTALPMYITESELLDYPKLVRDQVMLQTAVVPDDAVDKVDNIHHANKSEIKTYIKTLRTKVSSNKNTVIDEGNKTIKIKGNKGVLRINCPKQNNTNIVISLQGLERNTDTKKNQFRIVAKSGKIKKYAYCEKNYPRGFNDITEYNINMGKSEGIDDTIEVTLIGSGTYTYDDIVVYSVPMNALTDNAEELENHSYRIKDFDSHEGDCLKGEITTDKDSILFLSFPYDKGWKAYVDGKETDLLETIDIGFTGLVVSPGNHKVVLKYSHWGMKIAIVCTFIGLASLAYIVFRRRRNERNISS